MNQQSVDQRYILLRKANLRPRPLTKAWLSDTPLTAIEEVFRNLPDQSDIFLDVETTGLDPTDPTQEVVGVGLATNLGTYYLDTRSWDLSKWDFLGKAFRRHKTFSFNAPFDHSWFYRYCKGHINLGGDTLCLFKLLANEGWPGQSHRLEVLQDDILGWPSSQKATLDTLLVKHGITRGNGQSPDKSRMSELADLEPRAFAEYCALDAEAARQGWYELCRQAETKGIQGTLQYAKEEWTNEIELMIEGQHSGILMNQAGLAALDEQLTIDAAKLEGEIRKHPKLKEPIRIRERALLEKKARVSVRSKRTRAKPADQAHPSTGWLFEPSDAKTLSAEERKQGGYWYRLDYTYSIAGWSTDKPPPKFNFGSPADMGWLFYEYLYDWEETRDGIGRRCAKVTVERGRQVEVLLTPGGVPPVGKEVLPALGDVGQLFNRANKLDKLHEYVTSYILASARDGYIHPTFKSPGTISGRLSGGKDD